MLGCSLAAITLNINKYPIQKICGQWIYFEKVKAKHNFMLHIRESFYTYNTYRLKLKVFEEIVCANVGQESRGVYIYMYQTR